MAENITVQEMGEDGDLWLVTGTTDAHSADEAIRQHVEHMTGQTIEALTDADDLVEFTFNTHRWWVWRDLDLSGQPDERATLHAAPHFSGEAGAFFGFVVSA